LRLCAFALKLKGGFQVTRTIIVIGITVVCLGSLSVSGQNAGKKTVWDKIYTEEQAKRGEAVYSKTCAACHGEALVGGNAPPLKGDEFAFLWSDKSVGDLFDRMKTLMPPESPDSLSKETYRDVTAFVLRANNYPAGDVELPADQDELNRIVITVAKP
jgi:mono/diheme cytochrome c family protein